VVRECRGRGEDGRATSRQFRRRRRLSGRRRVPLTVAWARQGSAPCPGKVRALLLPGNINTMEPDYYAGAYWYHTEPAIKGSLDTSVITTLLGPPIVQG
jgi:hypothetical protein